MPALSLNIPLDNQLLFRFPSLPSPHLISPRRSKLAENDVLSPSAEGSTAPVDRPRAPQQKQAAVLEPNDEAPPFRTSGFCHPHRLFSASVSKGFSERQCSARRLQHTAVDSPPKPQDKAATAPSTWILPSIGSAPEQVVLRGAAAEMAVQAKIRSLEQAVKWKESTDTARQQDRLRARSWRKRKLAQAETVKIIVTEADASIDDTRSIAPLASISKAEMEIDEGTQTDKKSSSEAKALRKSLFLASTSSSEPTRKIKLNKRLTTLRLAKHVNVDAGTTLLALPLASEADIGFISDLKNCFRSSSVRLRGSMSLGHAEEIQIIPGSLMDRRVSQQKSSRSSRVCVQEPIPETVVHDEDEAGVSAEFQRKVGRPPNGCFDLCTFLSRKHKIALRLVKEVYDDFKSFDSDRNMMLSLDEFKECVRAKCRLSSHAEVPEHLMLALWKVADRDGSNAVEFEEYLLWSFGANFLEEIAVPDEETRLLRKMARELKMLLPDIEFFKTLFDKYDSDGTGTIEEGEFKVLLCEILKVDQSSVSSAALLRYWAEADTNRNGSVDFKEFLKWYLNMFC